MRNRRTVERHPSLQGRAVDGAGELQAAPRLRHRVGDVALLEMLGAESEVAGGCFVRNEYVPQYARLSSGPRTR
jgi:hypothetical protein